MSYTGYGKLPIISLSLEEWVIITAVSVVIGFIVYILGVKYEKP